MGILFCLKYAAPNCSIGAYGTFAAASECLRTTSKAGPTTGPHLRPHHALLYRTFLPHLLNSSLVLGNCALAARSAGQRTPIHLQAGSMTGARLPTVRIPQLSPGHDGDDDDGMQNPVTVDVAPPSKFGFAWPAEQPTTVPIPLASERSVTLSSSDGETDISEEELSAPLRRRARPEDFGDSSEFTTPTNNLNLEQNPMDVGGLVPPFPRLSRAFSMPLPSQLGSLQHPRRPSRSSPYATTPVPEATVELEHFRELSLELADSVQMVIQTLLQLSPPQVLDPVKEQFSACSLSIPTPSISAMFTSMKNLNYMSANMSALSTDTTGTSHSAATPAISNVQSDFDVGEMLQSVGDALGGVAAQSGVDLVLFHGDVGMKHISVKGDENGLSYTLSHVGTSAFPALTYTDQA